MRLLFPLCFCACLISSAVFANGGGYGKGVVSTSAFQPIGVEQVEMLSELLEIDLHIEYADIRIEYVLHNPGKKVTVECGFPAVIEEGGMFAPLPPLAPGERPKPREPKKLEGFSLLADGKEIPAKVREDQAGFSGNGGRQIETWHVVKIPFAAGQTRHIKVHYRNPYHISFRSVSDDWNQSAPSLTYAFSAAALWSGPIKQGTVIVNATSVDPAGVRFSHPKRFTGENGTWKWSFTDLEPTLEDDLVITTQPPLQGYHGGYVAEGGEWKGDIPKNARWMRYVGFTATASSVLKEADGSEHKAENVADWDRGTAWVEGQESDGVGESITLTLKKPAKISRVGIENGYTKSRELYAANNRVMVLKVSVNDGKPFDVDVPDEFLEKEEFWFSLPKSSELVKTIKLEIAAIYPGSTYHDTAISSVRLISPLDKAPKIQPAR
ncbi:NADase-type glycan-binding domain-containing protein [Prosthecobacter sp.]|uniref:NADase-type glycan-binding domain-containing protein n=1 Tax=Prosthecobacter sp. TaxID=1965333 RepID=UPI0037831040